MNKVILGDALEKITELGERPNLIYIDPPFNTGKIQRKKTYISNISEHGNVGFGRKIYENKEICRTEYNDNNEDYNKYMGEIIRNCYDILSDNGSFYLHLDWREVYNIKIWCDWIFGKENFINEIIWAYDFGGRGKNTWPRKHDNILFYVKNKDDYYFNRDASDKIQYLSPELVGAEKAERGKFPTDVWWISIVGTNSYEKTGYVNQKPKKLLQRVVGVSSKPGDLILDCFAGSGTTGEVAFDLDRRFICIDNNPQAIEIMKNRFDLKKIPYDLILDK